MSHAEFVEWLAFYQSEPFGGVRDDIHAALIVTMLANVNRNPKKKKTPFKPSEFMPDWWRLDKLADRAEGPGHVAGLLAKMQMFTTAIEPISDQEIEIGDGT